jgi:hypothetical protein
MALTFTDWEHCDDPNNPTLDWSSPDALQGRLPLRYIDAVLQAYQEKRYPLIYLAAKPAPEPHRGHYVTTVGDALPIARSYVNHTLATEWDGADYADFAPNWTDATVLAALGDAEFYPVPVPGQLLSSAFRYWLVQQKRILSLCRWTRYDQMDGRWQSPYTLYPESVDGARRRVGLYPASYPDWHSEITAQWAAAPWVADGGGQLRCSASWDRLQLEVSATRFRKKWMIARLPTDCACSIDWYTRIWTQIPPNQFHANGEAISEGKMWGFQLADGPAATITRTSDYPTTAETLPVLPTISGSTYNIGWYAQSGVSPRAWAYPIFKWDVPGGFVFV